MIQEIYFVSSFGQVQYINQYYKFLIPYINLIWMKLMDMFTILLLIVGGMYRKKIDCSLMTKCDVNM